MLPPLCAPQSALWPVKCTGIVLTSVRTLAVSMLSERTLSQERWPFTTRTRLSLCLRLFRVTARLSASLPFPSICSSVVFFFSFHLLLALLVLSLSLAFIPDSHATVSLCLPSGTDFESVNLCSYYQYHPCLYLFVALGLICWFFSQYCFSQCQVI